MAKELELKLACEVSIGFDKLLEALVGYGAAVDSKSHSVRQLENTYFDTSRLDLNKQRIALRIRKAGEVYIQTLKTAGQSINGMHRRGEWEWPLATPQLDLSKLDELDAWHAIAHSRSITLKLQPIFKTDFQRTAIQFSYQGYRFELVLDEGDVAIPGTNSSMPINEIEIEYLSNSSLEIDPANALASGEDDHADLVGIMHDLGAQLCEHLPLKPSDISKAQRGYALFKQTEGV